MTSRTATVTLTTKQIELPADTVVHDFHISIIKPDGTTATDFISSLTPNNLRALDVSKLPSGVYTMKAQRRSNFETPIGEPVLTQFVLDQTVEVPATVTVTLA